MDSVEERFGDGRRSSVVRTPAMTWGDAPPGPDYLNAALGIDCSCSLEELLVFTQSIEDLFGRQRNERWGSRTLDIDILWAPMSHDAPRVPHPGLFERAFALGPALEVEAELKEYAPRLEALGAPPLVLPPLVETAPGSVSVRRALDEQDALALAWGATAGADAETSWVEASPDSPLRAAGACIALPDKWLIKPAGGKWELELLQDTRCVLRARED